MMLKMLWMEVTALRKQKILRPTKNKMKKVRVEEA